MMNDIPAKAVEAGTEFYGNLLPHIDARMIAPMWHIFTLGHIVATDLDRIARRFELSIADIHLLGTVRIDQAQPLRAIDLARVLNVSQATLSARIERLVRAGLLTRSRLSDDKRAFALRLTEAGERIADMSVDTFLRDAKLVHALSRLSADDLSAFTRIIGRLHHELDRIITPGMPETT